MTDAARPRRRWFQFRLMSLFLLTTLVAIWLAWELNFIRERQAWLRENAALLDSPTPNPTSAEVRASTMAVLVGGFPCGRNLRSGGLER